MPGLTISYKVKGNEYISGYNIKIAASNIYNKCSKCIYCKFIDKLVNHIICDYKFTITQEYCFKGIYISTSRPDLK